jgi:hypothetical protein
MESVLSNAGGLDDLDLVTLALAKWDDTQAKNSKWSGGQFDFTGVNLLIAAIDLGRWNLASDLIDYDCQMKSSELRSPLGAILESRDPGRISILRLMLDRRSELCRSLIEDGLPEFTEAVLDTLEERGLDEEHQLVLEFGAKHGS